MRLATRPLLPARLWLAPACALPAVIAVLGPIAPAQDPVARPVAGETRAPAAAACGSRVALAKVWAVLRESHDRDGDGVVTRDEYPRGDVRFSNFDRNRDGRLDAHDFPDDAFVNGFNHWLVRMADADGDGAVVAEEWGALERGLDADGDGTVAPGELAAKVGPDASRKFELFLLSFDQDLDGRFTKADLAIAFRDLDVDGDGALRGEETRRWRPTAARPSTPLPKVGEPAPDFELPRADDASKRFSLASFRGARPVALVFGSYT